MFACLGFAIAACCSVACAQTDSELLFGPWKDHGSVDSNSEWTIFNRTRAKANGASFDFAEIRSSGRWRLDQSHEINPSLGYDWTQLHIGSSAHLLPTQLDDISVAAASPLGASGDWFTAALVGGGYAGDAAFADDGWYGKAELIAGRTLGNGDSIGIAIDYDGNRTLLPDVPIPIFVYNGHVGTTIEYTIGFPVASFDWRPTDQWHFWGDLSFPASIEGAVEYRLTRSLFSYASFVSQEDAFHSSELPGDRRLFSQENRVEVGVRWLPIDQLELSIGAGYSFDRRFSRGFDDRNLKTVTRLSDEPDLRLAMTFRF